MVREFFLLILKLIKDSYIVYLVKLSIWYEFSTFAIKLVHLSQNNTVCRCLFDNICCQLPFSQHFFFQKFALANATSSLSFVLVCSLMVSTLEALFSPDFLFFSLQRTILSSFLPPLSFHISSFIARLSAFLRRFCHSCLPVPT